MFNQMWTIVSQEIAKITNFSLSMKKFTENRQNVGFKSITTLVLI